MIIYALVALGSAILSEYTNTRGNFLTITRRLLENIPLTEDCKKTYTFDRHLFHYILEDGMIYLCMTEENTAQRISFAFLEDIKNRFKVTYGLSAKTAPPLGMNEDFSRVLQNQMNYFSNSKAADKINKVKGDIEEIKSVMVENIEKVLQRGEQIENLVDQTKNLETQAIRFKKESGHLKRAMWIRNLKITCVLVFVVLILVYLLTAIICGGLAFQGCRKKSST